MKGIGVETVLVSSIRDYIANDGSCALSHLFTEAERSQCLQTPRSMETFAGVMAAKEALLKAVPALRKLGSNWADMEVCLDQFGVPHLRLTGRSLENAKKLGVENWHLSISHSDTSAMAFVVVA